LSGVSASYTKCSKYGFVVELSNLNTFPVYYDVMINKHSILNTSSRSLPSLAPLRINSTSSRTITIPAYFALHIDFVFYSYLSQDSSGLGVSRLCSSDYIKLENYDCSKYAIDCLDSLNPADAPEGLITIYGYHHYNWHPITGDILRLYTKSTPANSYELRQEVRSTNSYEYNFNFSIPETFFNDLFKIEIVKPSGEILLLVDGCNLDDSSSNLNYQCGTNILKSASDSSTPEPTTTQTTHCALVDVNFRSKNDYTIPNSRLSSDYYINLCAAGNPVITSSYVARSTRSSRKVLDGTNFVTLYIVDAIYDICYHCE
jgi:hypothetical protein